MATATAHQLILLNVRLSFPKLWEAEAIEGGKPRYGCSLLIPKDDKAQLGAINRIIKAITDEEFGGKALPGDKLPIHDGSEKDFDGYDGVYYLSANRSEKQGRPTIVDQNKRPLTRDDGKPYPGCYVNAWVRFYAINGKSSKQPNGYGKRICASLEVVQFWKDGEQFGASKPDLGELPGGDEDGDDGLGDL